MTKVSGLFGWKMQTAQRQPLTTLKIYSSPAQQLVVCKIFRPKICGLILGICLLTQLSFPYFALGLAHPLQSAQSCLVDTNAAPSLTSYTSACGSTLISSSPTSTTASFEVTAGSFTALLVGAHIWSTGVARNSPRRLLHKVAISDGSQSEMQCPRALSSRYGASFQLTFAL